MGDEPIPADLLRVMRTATRQEHQDRPARSRFARPAEAADRPVEYAGYEIDPDAVADAILARLLAGRTLRPGRDLR